MFHGVEDALSTFSDYLWISKVLGIITLLTYAKFLCFLYFVWVHKHKIHIYDTFPSWRLQRGWNKRNWGFVNYQGITSISFFGYISLLMMYPETKDC